MKKILGKGNLLFSDPYQDNNLQPDKTSRRSLKDCSPTDSKWNSKRANAELVRDFYKGGDLERYARRIDECSRVLHFAFGFTKEVTGKYKLEDTRFCRVLLCPVCMWRKAMMWQSRAIQILPKVTEDYPTHRFIFLTLTVKTCPVNELRQTITWMNKAWKKFADRAVFPAVGWLRSVEVTKSDNYFAHPHFHCLLMVKAQYFNGANYLTHAKWKQLWQESLNIDYDPQIRINVVKPKSGKDYSAEIAGILETFKYCVDMEKILENVNNSEKDKEWIVGVTNQLYKMRLIATGGILKKYLKELEEERSDLIHSNTKEEEFVKFSSHSFAWKTEHKEYFHIGE